MLLRPIVSQYPFSRDFQPSIRCLFANVSRSTSCVWNDSEHCGGVWCRIWHTGHSRHRSLLLRWFGIKCVFFLTNTLSEHTGHYLQETARQVRTKHGDHTLVFSERAISAPVIVGEVNQSVLFRLHNTCWYLSISFEIILDWYGKNFNTRGCLTLLLYWIRRSLLSQSHNPQNCVLSWSVV